MISKPVRNIAIGFVAVAIWVIAGALAQRNSSTSTAPTRQAETAPQHAQSEEPTAFVTTAKKLASDYEANEVAEDQAINGREVLISGQVVKVEKDFTNAMLIELATGNDFMGARLYMKDGEVARVAALKKGQAINVRCKKMKFFMSAPLGNECVIAA